MLKMVMLEGCGQNLVNKRKYKGKLIIAQVYVDDIVFGGMSQKMVDLLVQQIKMTEFEMSMVGELTYFLGF